MTIRCSCKHPLCNKDGLLTYSGSLHFGVVSSNPRSTIGCGTRWRGATSIETSSELCITRSTIDRVRAEEKIWYGAFIDAKKAFPSTYWVTPGNSVLVHSHRLVFRGALFDWLRNLSTFSATALNSEASLSKLWPLRAAPTVFCPTSLRAQFLPAKPPMMTPP